MCTELDTFTFCVDTELTSFFEDDGALLDNLSSEPLPPLTPGCEESLDALTHAFLSGVDSDSDSLLLLSDPGSDLIIASSGDEEEEEAPNKLELNEVWVPIKRKRLFCCVDNSRVGKRRQAAETRRLETLFLSRVVEGSTYTTKVTWTVANLRDLWNCLVGRGCMGALLKRSSAYLRNRGDGTYTPTPRGIVKWGC